jgi:PPOX class probable F420-dependent enzyme
MSENTGLAEFRVLLSSTGRSVVVTVKKDGRPQLSTVDYCWDGDRLLRFSTTVDRAKVRNLRRDPRVSVQVSSPDGASYAVFEGIAELTPVSEAPDDGTVEELIDVFREVNGEHPDWDEYRAAMVADRRLVVKVRPDRAYGYIRPT